MPSLHPYNFCRKFLLLLVSSRNVHSLSYQLWDSVLIIHGSFLLNTVCAMHALQDVEQWTPNKSTLKQVINHFACLHDLGLTHLTQFFNGNKMMDNAQQHHHCHYFTVAVFHACNVLQRLQWSETHPFIFSLQSTTNPTFTKENHNKVPITLLQSML